MITLTALAVLLSPFAAVGFSGGLNAPFECVLSNQVAQQEKASSTQGKEKACCAKHQTQSKNAPASDPSPCSDPSHCPCCIAVCSGLMIAFSSTATETVAIEHFSFIRNTSNRLTLPGWQDPLLRPPIL